MPLLYYKASAMKGEMHASSIISELPICTVGRGKPKKPPCLATLVTLNHQKPLQIAEARLSLLFRAQLLHGPLGLHTLDFLKRHDPFFQGILHYKAMNSYRASLTYSMNPIHFGRKIQSNTSISWTLHDTDHNTEHSNCIPLTCLVFHCCVPPTVHHERHGSSGKVDSCPCGVQTAKNETRRVVLLGGKCTHCLDALDSAHRSIQACERMPCFLQGRLN